MPRRPEYPFGRARGTFGLGWAPGDPLPGGAPLLAYGANASPRALRAKLGADARVAALAGRLRGWRVVHSAHVSPYGAVPATLLADPAGDEPVHVLLGADLAVLDATEPNYVRRALDVDLDVVGLGRLASVEAYVSRWGALRVDGAPVALGALAQDALVAALRGVGAGVSSKPTPP